MNNYLISFLAWLVPAGWGSCLMQWSIYAKRVTGVWIPPAGWLLIGLLAFLVGIYAVLVGSRWIETAISLFRATVDWRSPADVSTERRVQP